MSKISQYPAASTLTGAESVYVVQSGNGKKVPVSNILTDNLFTPSGTSAVARSVQDALRQIFKAYTTAELLAAGVTGASPNTAIGVQFSGDNSTPAIKVFGSVICEKGDVTPGAEGGRLHFLLNDGNFLQDIGTVDQNGAWILGPGIDSFTAQVAGLLSVNGGPVTAALFAERVSAVDLDLLDSIPLAVRALRFADVTDLTQKVGVGFTALDTSRTEVMVGKFRFQFGDRTASARTKAFLSLKYDGNLHDGPIFDTDSFTTGDHNGFVPGLHAVKPYVNQRVADYSIQTSDSGAVVDNTGAKTKLIFTLPNLASVGNGFHVRIHTGITPISQISGFKWTASGADAGAFYLVTNANGNPGFTVPASVRQGLGILAAGVLGSLANGQWAFGDSDALGFSTIYVQTAGGDPDGLSTPFFVTYPIRVTTTNTGLDTIYYTGATDSMSTVDSDGLLGTLIELFSLRYQVNIQGWQGSKFGTWTKV